MMAIVGSSGSPSCPVSRKLMVSLYCSLNMLEGDTGYASFLYFFHMDDVLVGHWIIKLSLKFRTKTLHLLPSKGILLIYNRYGVKRISVLCVCVCVCFKLHQRIAIGLVYTGVLFGPQVYICQSLYFLFLTYSPEKHVLR